MNKTIKYITMATIGLTFMFGDTGELTNVPNKVYPNEKPIVSIKSRHNTTAQVTDTSERPKRLHKKVFDLKIRPKRLHKKGFRDLKVKNYPNSWSASHVHNGCHTEKVKAVSNVDRPKRLRKRGR